MYTYIYSVLRYPNTHIYFWLYLLMYTHIYTLIYIYTPIHVYSDPVKANKVANNVIIALGIGNAISSFFEGFGGCVLIPNTILNNRQGGESYVSSLAYAFSILLSVLLFAPMLGQVPVAALAGMCSYDIYRCIRVAYDVYHTFCVLAYTPYTKWLTRMFL